MPHQFITSNTRREVFRKANVANMTAQQVEDFIHQNKYHWNHLISMAVKYNEVKEKGLQEGINIGKEEGIAIGQEKGKEVCSYETTLSMAKRLKTVVQISPLSTMSLAYP